MSDKKGTLYALKGKIGSGKRDALNDLYKQLIGLYQDAKVEKLFEESSVTVIISYKDKIIGIESDCSNADWLKKNLELFREKNCNMIFCPCRTRNSKSLKIVNEMVNEYDIEFTFPKKNKCKRINTKNTQS